MHEVLDRSSFGQELGAGGVAEVIEPAGLERGTHLFAGTRRNGALHDQYRRRSSGDSSSTTAQTAERSASPE